MHSDRLCELSLSEAAELVRKKQVSPVELTRACLGRIEREDKSLNSFISVFGDEALDQAGEAELEISRNGWRGPLHGIPIAIKDLIDM